MIRPCLWIAPKVTFAGNAKMQICNLQCCKRSQEHIFLSLWQPTLALCISIFDHRAICPCLVYLAFQQWNKQFIPPAIPWYMPLILSLPRLNKSCRKVPRWDFHPEFLFAQAVGLLEHLCTLPGRLPGREMVAEWMHRLWSIRLNLPNGQAQWLLEVKKRVSLDY